MTLRRGFKAQAAELAQEVRAELGLRPLDRLDPRVLALHLTIPIVTLSELAADADGARHFLLIEPGAFSALTVFFGHRRLIVHNDSHSEARQNSDLVHELAHGLLLHEPTTALDGATGCRNWNDRIEAEANWLTGELLVTRRAALSVAPWAISEASGPAEARSERRNARLADKRDRCQTASRTRAGPPAHGWSADLRDCSIAARIVDWTPLTLRVRII